MKKKLHIKFKTKLKKVFNSSCDSYCSVVHVVNALMFSVHLAWDEYRKQQNVRAESAKNDLIGIYQSIRLAANLPSKSNTQSIKDDKIISAENLNENFCEIGP